MPLTARVLVPVVSVPANLRVSEVIAIELVTFAFITIMVVPISSGTDAFAGIVIV